MWEGRACQGFWFKHTLLLHIGAVAAEEAGRDFVAGEEDAALNLAHRFPTGQHICSRPDLI